MNTETPPAPPATTNWQKMDWWLASALLLGSLLFTIVTLDPQAHPAEDAAILMRYAQNLARGHGIVWNVGEAPVDGATDFLFMVMVACVNRVGVSIEAATRGLSLGAHFATVLLVYLAGRRLNRVPPLLTFVAALSIAVGPGVGYAEAYFGTPVFALCIAISWASAAWIAGAGESPGRAVTFALLSLVAGLVRPEGVFLTAFILLALLWYCGWHRLQRTVLAYVIVFATLGSLYFFWRWDYFGYPLPNPFYKKGSGLPYWGSLKVSILNTLLFAAPFLPAFALGLRTRAYARTTLFAAIPIVCFTLLWLLLSNETNYLARFQYAIFPLIAMAWPPLVAALPTELGFPAWRRLGWHDRLAIEGAMLVTVMIMAGYLYGRYAWGVHVARDGRYEAARMLADYRERDYTLATTEAGLLPFYSEWRTVDALGLNDQWIAHHNGITEEYIARFQPEIIMFHAYFSPIVPHQEDGWTQDVVSTLKRYAERHDYHLAAAYGESPYDTHYYYVRRGLPESAEIVARLRGLDYGWYTTGKRSVNYALLLPVAP